jgi:hypothetical protein
MLSPCVYRAQERKRQLGWWDATMDNDWLFHFICSWLWKNSGIWRVPTDHSDFVGWSGAKTYLTAIAGHSSH